MKTIQELKKFIEDVKIKKLTDKKYFSSFDNYFLDELIDELPTLKHNNYSYFKNYVIKIYNFIQKEVEEDEELLEIYLSGSYRKKIMKTFVFYIKTLSFMEEFEKI